MVPVKIAPPTRIVKGTPLITEINFFHTDEVRHAAALALVRQAAEVISAQPGLIAVNLLVSTDQSRICTYIQAENAALLQSAHQIAAPLTEQLRTSKLLLNAATPRTYQVVYTDDRSLEGVSVISQRYTGAIFINEITTERATQDRLLELVIANNQIQSIATPGYRSANFHKSDDGARAVNYSLWDSEAHCIDAISRMADMDENLEETIQIASPDFRFFTLVYATHA